MLEEKTAFVYSGAGAGVRSVASTVWTLRTSLTTDIQVKTLSASELLAGQWQSTCILLAIPGGADLPYCQQLNGLGNQHIADYVRDGGAYLGLCAGAYYACSRVEFEVGTRLEVVGDRELGFFPGTAQGSVYPGFLYQTEAGTHAAPLQILATEPASGRQHHTTADLQHSSEATPRSLLKWHECYDYVNGSPAFVLSTGCHAREAVDLGVKVLATYSDHGGAAAAVACKVGAGVAVLCGSHPELPADWLDAACDAGKLKEAGACTTNDEAAASAERLQAIRDKLLASASNRQEFWRMLLAEAGLATWLQPL